MYTQSIIYGALAEAINFYEAHDFIYIDLPWTVSKQAGDIILPHDRTFSRVIPLSGECCIMGAEAFLEAVLNKKLKHGNYVGCVPCFNPLNKKEPYMMEVVLFAFGSNEIEDTLAPTFDFHQTHLGWEKLTQLKVSDTQTNILFDGLEMASHRVYNRKPIGKFVYGAGCVEPRFSMTYKEIVKKQEGDERQESERQESEKVAVPHVRVRPKRLNKKKEYRT